MEWKDKILEVLKTRYQMYCFLSRLYILEVDEILLEKLKQMEFPKTSGIDELDEGYECIQKYLQEFNDNVTDKLDETAVDYADVFLAAGVAQGLAAFPYEPVYTSKKKLVMQEASEQVQAIYAMKGLVLGDGFPKVPNDHAAVEMEYMAFLCDEAIKAVKLENEEAFQETLTEQKKFFRAHIQNWVPMLCQDMNKYAKTTFYQGLGKITAGFIKWEENYGLQD